MNEPSKSPYPLLGVEDSALLGPATNRNSAPRVCASWHHLPGVFTTNGTDRCDECWFDAQADAAMQAMDAE